MRKLLILLVLLGFGTFVGSWFVHPPLECHVLEWQYRNNDLRSPHRYCDKPQEELTHLWDSLESHRMQLEQSVAREEEIFTQRMMELSEEHRVRRDNAIIEEHTALKKLRLELANTIAEQDDIRAALMFKRYPIGMIGLAVGVVALFLLLIGFVMSKMQIGGPTAAFRKAVRHTDLDEWIEPDRADAVMYTLVLKEKFAVQELWNLRPRTCAYCNARLPVDPAGTVQHVTLLKKAPTDVTNPKRFVLGRGFRAVPPESVTCQECGHQARL